MEGAEGRAREGAVEADQAQVEAGPRGPAYRVPPALAVVVLESVPRSAPEGSEPEVVGQVGGPEVLEGLGSAYWAPTNVLRGEVGRWDCVPLSLQQKRNV